MKTIDKVWWDKVIKNGIFAALFVVLLVYVIRTNDERETRYINMINTLNDTVNVKLVELKALHMGSKS
ncbi:BhlA/UviB family holin-like peptide [Paenibacillus sp. Soil724D2]|uniref:BhlA/UviB family holin-like peptide n=1 Tax=Paenibacillus sp. (strain Soil724D2) TaxID=1736392 RepID=UPI00138F21FC